MRDLGKGREGRVGWRNMPLSTKFLCSRKTLLVKTANIILWKDNICTCQISYFFANFYKLPTNNFYKYTIKCDVIQLMKYVAVCYNDILNIQWRIQEFLNRGARFRRLEFVGSGDCFDVPSHITYHFVLMADIKRHIVKIACWVQSKFTCVMQ